MTTETTLTLPPSADLTGSWQKTEPLPVDDAGFVTPVLKAWAAAQYLVGDAAAGQTQAEALTLPDLGEVAAATPTLVGSSSAVPTTYVTSKDVAYPSGIEANDIILLYGYYWSDLSTDAVASTGFTEEYNIRDPAQTYDVRVCCLRKVATGSETGNITATIGTAVRFGLAVEVWRGVDTTTPFDVTEDWISGGADINPDPVTTVTDGAVVQVIVGGRVSGGDATVDPPTNYTEVIDTCSNTYTGFLSSYQLIDTAGVENPGAVSYGATRSTAITQALRPASVAPDRTLVVAASSADETASAALVGSDCVLNGRNEIQDITSTLGSGTFTITFDGQTTAAINWNDTAATVQTRLEALSNIGVGDVDVAGGPLNTDVVVVEFTGALAKTNVAQMTTSSGNVTVATTVGGLADENFVYEGDINVPRAGGSMEPQAFLWSLTPTAGYLAGRTITFDVSDHGTLKSWAAVLQVWADLDTANPLETFGTESTGSGSVADIGPITPATQGSRVLAGIAKALSAGNYSVPNGTTTPARTASGGAALADSMSLGLFVTPPVAAAALDLGTASWSGTELFATGVASLKPATPPTGGLDLYQVIDQELTDSWIEIAGSAGSLDEVIEVDTAALPADAYVTALSVEFAHQADAAHKVLALPVGITAGGVPVVAAPLTAGHAPSPLGSTVQVETGRYVEFPDGTTPSDYSRFGIALRSLASKAGLSTHQVFWARLKVHYLAGGPVVSNVVGPTTAGDPVTWDYSSAGGFPMTEYRVLVMQGATGDPLTATPASNPWAPGAGEIIWDTGWIRSSDARQWSSAGPLYRDDMTVAVRAATTVNGNRIESAWATDAFSISGLAPSAATLNTAPALNTATGVVEMSIDTPASVSRAWVLRSDDAGSTWALAATNPFAVTASATDQQLYDDAAPLVDGGLWRVILDNGVMTESSPQLVMNAVALDATPPEWYLQLPGSPASNVQLEVPALDPIDQGRRALTVRRAGAAIVATSGLFPATITLTARVRSASARAALEALLAQDDPLRLTDILGRSWTVRPTVGTAEQLQRWMPLAIDTTGLPDVHDVPLVFQEVTTS